MFQRLTSPFKLLGILGGLGYIIDRALSRISGRTRLYIYDFMVQPITDKPLIPAQFAKNLRIREVRQGEPELDLMPRSASMRKMRFDQGAECYGAFRKDELVAYIWFRQGGYKEDEVRADYLLSPMQQSVFDFDVYVYPEHRMGLAFVGLWDGVNSMLHERGIRHSFSRLTRYNTASKKSHDRLRWRHVASAVILKAWNLELMFANIHPYVSLTFGDASRPKLHLSAPTQ